MYQCTLTHSKTKLFGTSALVCLALAAPVMAADFVITGSDNSTNGTGTTNGGTAAAIADTAINGSDTVSLGIALTTTADNEGIQTSADGNAITVTEAGSITTGTGNYAHGIYNNGHDNTTIMSGSISTAERLGYGVYNYGDNNTTTMSGSFSSTGNFGFGIYNKGSGNTTTMSGSISTTGDKAYGIHNGDNNANNNVYSDNNTTTVSGSIKTEGVEAHGIYNDGNNNTTTISGTVKATGAKSAALYNVYGSDNSFTLNEGATIIGDILARVRVDGTIGATYSKLIFNLGASTSYRYSVSGKGEGTTAGQWTFSDLDGRTQGVTTTGTGCDTTITTITVCNLVTGVSTGNLEVQDELQFSMNSSMISSLKFGSGQADAPAEAMSFTQSSKSNTWANVYGGTSKRASSTTKLAFDTSNRGLTIGTPVSINDTLDVDLVFNVSRTSLDIGLTKDQEITSNSYNLGAVLRDLAPSTGWAVDAFGFVGRNSYDGKRKVMNNQEATGSETVTAAYSGSEVLVGVDAQYSNPINDTLNFIGGVNASLSNEKIGAYSESKYYAWDARTMMQATGGITAGLEYQKDALTTFASLGLQRSSLQNGKTATYTNNGTAASFTDSSTGDTRRSITVGFDYVGNEGMTFSGAVEAFSSTGGVSGNSASLSANWSF